jgi:hypothetical protein
VGLSLSGKTLAQMYNQTGVTGSAEKKRDHFDVPKQCPHYHFVA